MTMQTSSAAPFPYGQKKSLLREYVSALVWAVALALVIRTFVVQTFEIPSGSMENTLQIGDYLIANKFLYGLRLPWSGERVLTIREPRRGDVVIFKYPKDPSQDFIKRLVGLPGDEVMVRDKVVYVNGKVYADPHEIHKDSRVQPTSESPRDEFGPVKVPQGSYFMMGDNRDESYDSRFWGFVKGTDILGLAMVKYWSIVPGTWQVRWGNLGQIIS
jgi:signal peptidase I